MWHKTTYLMILGCIFFQGSLIAKTPHIGKHLFYEYGCIKCHGESGENPVMPFYPKIAGHNALYIINQFFDIQNGSRNNGLTVTMRPFTLKTDTTSIKNISLYLAQDH